MERDTAEVKGQPPVVRSFPELLGEARTAKGGTRSALTVKSPQRARRGREALRLAGSGQAGAGRRALAGAENRGV
eukprot:204755-Lingulodinium_polyedra.AAC.1